MDEWTEFTSEKNDRDIYQSAEMPCIVLRTVVYMIARALWLNSNIQDKLRDTPT